MITKHMKLLLVLGLAFGIIVSFTRHTASAQERGESGTVSEKTNGLQVSLLAQKRRYKRADQIKMQVILTNVGKEEVYVFGTLEWGYSASFILHILDASGREIDPVGFPDDQTHAFPDDKHAFVKLVPNHFLGTNFFAPLNVLNLVRPGKYSIFVEYNSPFSASAVDLHPFWGKENGTIKSNVVHVEVLR
jgi:hypothetical protein